MATSILKLEFEKGPRNGETLEFNPKSTVRIGRLVRGNNLQIKDPGISSKHLKIEFNSNSGNWVITDLDSSNGTFLNSSQIEPLTPMEIGNGDEIKIGELTAIRVRVVEVREEVSVRRNPRRGGVKKGGVDLGGRVEEGENLEGKSLVRVGDVKGGEAETGTGIGIGVESKRGRGRGRPKKVSALEGGDNASDGNVEGVKPKQEGGAGGRRTRGSNREREECSGQVEVMPARRTRSGKNVRADSVLEEVPESEGFDGEECREAENGGGKKKRGGRGAKKKVDDECLDGDRDVVLDDAEYREVMETKVQSVGKQPCGDPVVEAAAEEMVEKTTREVLELEVLEQIGRAVVTEEQHREESKDDVEHREELEGDAEHNVMESRNEEQEEIKVPEQAGGVLDAGEEPSDELMLETCQQNENIATASHSEQEIGDGLESFVVPEDGEASESDMEEIAKELDTDPDRREKDKEADVVLDLEKMTLGELFDYLEVYFPRQIHNVADEIIADIRKKGKQINDFMLQQQNEKGKFPAAT